MIGTNKISIDLELEQPNTNKQTPDSVLSAPRIIQVGWCVFNSKDGSILESDGMFVGEKIKLSSFIKNLTGIEDDDITGEYTPLDAFNKLRTLREKYNASRRIIEWGSGDLSSLKEEVIALIGKEEYSKLNPFGKSGVNLKHLFQFYAEVNGLNSSGGLSRSAEKIGVKWGNCRKHNAICDALHTAKMYFELSKRISQVV